MNGTTNEALQANKVEVIDGVARLWRDGAVTELEVLQLPDGFVRWQLECKNAVYDSIERDEYVAFNAAHLPVVGTLNQQSLVPNLANKGVGFTPKDEYLEEYLALVEGAVERIRRLPPGSVHRTRDLRLAAAREFYAHPDHIDWRRLGLLEIFEGTTYANLVQRPVASVLWTGNSPSFLSIQVDCVVEIVAPEDLRYRFLWGMRRLFEYEPFHIVQTMFPYSYCFWVVGVTDKTPKSRCPGKPGERG